MNHPLNTGRRVNALADVVRWQIGSRLLPGPVAVPFVSDSVLLVEHGMTGATGAVYCGLHEYKEMAFVLHLLRPNDLFFDIGANVGSYTVLAAAAGARVVACEPVPETWRKLQRNIAVNHFEAVEALNVGVGDAQERLWFTTNLDTTNRVAPKGTRQDDMCEVDVIRVDDLVRDFGAPVALKVDVEGYEFKVLKGAQSWLNNNGVAALIVERNPSSVDYGPSFEAAWELVEQAGFIPVDYEPAIRVVAAGRETEGAGNQIFIRDIETVRRRCKEAPRYSVAGRAL